MDRTHQDIHDELLVLQCQNGDADALKALVARYHPRFGRLAWHLTAEREAVRDIVQESWLAIIRGINRLDDPARFRAWAGRIVRNKCSDWTRRKVVHRSATQDLRNAAAISAPGNPSAESESESELTRMRDALAKLPAQQRAILSLHYLDTMTVAEIASVLDIPPGTVKSRLHHARNRLKKSLERTEP